MIYKPLYDIGGTIIYKILPDTAKTVAKTAVKSIPRASSAAPVIIGVLAVVAIIGGCIWLAKKNKEST